MTGRVNHRGWIVLESISSTDGMLCVDFFEDPDGGFGFEQLRADVEDRGRWTAVGGLAGLRFATAAEAAMVAPSKVPWLVDEGAARRRLDAWRAELDPAR